MLIRNYALISSAFAIAAASALLLSPSGFDDYDLAEGPDYAYRVAVDDEGYVYVATTCTSEEDSKDIVLLKYAAEIGSDPIWDVSYNGPGDEDDIATGIVIDSNGYIYVCGTSEGSGTGKDVFLRKYASSDGAPIWTARYNSGGDNDDYATDMTLDASGNLLICGTIDDEAELDGLIIVYEPAGTIKEGWPVWYDPGDGPNNQVHLNAIATDESNGVFAVGFQKNVSTGKNGLALQYNGGGESVNTVIIAESGEGELLDACYTEAGIFSACGYRDGTNAAREDSLEPGQVDRRFWQCEIADKVR